MTTLIKLGGSLITDKSKARSFRADVLRHIARQIKRIRDTYGSQPIILGHGSGSFGHVEASKHRTVDGVRSEKERLGFAKVGAVATELSLLVLSELIAAGLPAMRFQPSSSIVCKRRQIISFEHRALLLALDKGFLPLIHGDIALDEAINGTIVSTEAIFARLARPLQVRRIILLGEVEGVYDGKGEIIRAITPETLGEARSSLAGSRGVDVTGGMLQKVETMVDIVREHPAVEVTIADGRQEGVIVDLLVKQGQIGTRIFSDRRPKAP
jgi:isopentenyl phosphate kinase